MKLTGFANSSHDLSLLKAAGYEEVILGMREFSRFGKLDGKSFGKLAADATVLGLKVVFDWDILMTEDAFQKCIKDIGPYLELADVLRVQDPGAYHWALTGTDKPLQFIAESGNHNLEALLGWCEAGHGRLERIILSIELSRDSLKEYCEKLPVPCELLGLGRILLFYSPRSLLSPLSPEKIGVNEDIEVLGESEESPHKGFPVLENRHGTFMFHIKEFCLIDYAQDLKTLGLSWLRIDQRFNEKNFSAEAVKIVNREAMFENFKAEYPQDLMRGFYHVNKSDVLFPKLKNMRLQNRSGDYLGEVLEAEKASHLAILIKNPKGIKLGDKFQIIHPKGEIFEGEVRSLRNVNLEEVSEIPVDELALLPFINGVWVKSQLFLKMICLVLFLLSNSVFASEITQIELTFSSEGKNYFISRGLLKKERFDELKIIIDEKATDPDWVMLYNQPVHSASNCFRGDVTKASDLVRKLITNSGIQFSLLDVRAKNSDQIFENYRQENATGGVSNVGVVNRCK